MVMYFCVQTNQTLKNTWTLQDLLSNASFKKKGYFLQWIVVMRSLIMLQQHFYGKDKANIFYIF